MCERLEMELLRYVMDIKDDITEIKTSIKDFENRIDNFEDKIDGMGKKILDIETNLSINTFGVEEIEKREMFFRRTKRFFNDYILTPMKTACTKGIVTAVLMFVSIIITWLLTWFDIIPDAKTIFEYIK